MGARCARDIYKLKPQDKPVYFSILPDPEIQTEEEEEAGRTPGRKLWDFSRERQKRENKIIEGKLCLS